MCPSNLSTTFGKFAFAIGGLWHGTIFHKKSVNTFMHWLAHYCEKTHTYSVVSITTRIESRFLSFVDFIQWKRRYIYNSPLIDQNYNSIIDGNRDLFHDPRTLVWVIANTRLKPFMILPNASHGVKLFVRRLLWRLTMETGLEVTSKHIFIGYNDKDNNRYLAWYQSFIHIGYYKRYLKTQNLMLEQNFIWLLWYTKHTTVKPVASRYVLLVNRKKLQRKERLVSKASKQKELRLQRHKLVWIICYIFQMSLVIFLNPHKLVKMVWYTYKTRANITQYCIQHTNGKLIEAEWRIYASVI